MRIHLTVALAVAAAACTDPSPQPQPNEMERVVNATRVDPGIPPGALGNESVNYPEGPVTPAEREQIRDVEKRTPKQVVAGYADLLEQRRFDDAYGLWDPNAAGFSREQFAERFNQFETIRAEVGTVAPPEGAAGSIYDEVQLTLTGEKKDGTNYTVTGPVTVRRVNDVPGSTAEQRRWRIVKMVLTADPAAAEALVEPTGGRAQ